MTTKKNRQLYFFFFTFAIETKEKALWHGFCYKTDGR